MDESRLKRVMANIFDIPGAEINEESSMETIINWDSLKHIQLMTAIEEEFQIILSIENMISMTNYPTILKVLSEYEK